MWCLRVVFCILKAQFIRSEIVFSPYACPAGKITKMAKTREHQLKTEQVWWEKHSFTCRETEAPSNIARKSDWFLKWWDSNTFLTTFCSTTLQVQTAEVLPWGVRGPWWGLWLTSSPTAPSSHSARWFQPAQTLLEVRSSSRCWWTSHWSLSGLWGRHRKLSGSQTGAVCLAWTCSWWKCDTFTQDRVNY